MKNRVLVLMVAILVVAGLLIAACAPKAAPAPSPGPAPAPAPAPEKTWNLRFGHWIPLVSAYHTDAFEPWVQKIKERTNGRVNITIYGGESIGKMMDLYDLTATGAVDISMFADNPRFSMTEVSSLPFLFPSAAIASCSMQELCEKYLQQADLKDVKVLWMFTNSPYQCFTRSKQMKTLEDFKGVKFYVTGSELYVKVAEALGLEAVSLSPPEAYTAMQSGIVEGCFLNVEGQWIWKYALATKYRTIIPESLTLYLMGVIINWDVWNSFPPDIQKIFEEESGVKWAYNSGNAMDQADIVSYKEILDYDAKQGNPPFYYVPQAEFDRWKAVEKPLIDQWIQDKEAKGLPGRAMYEDAVKLSAKYAKMYPPPEVPKP